MLPRRLTALCGVAAALTGCGHVSLHRRVVTHTLPPSVSISPRPTQTVLHAFHRSHVSETAVVQAQSGVSLRLTVSKPAVSTTRLSKSYGYPPSHRYYLTFHLVIANTGSQPVQLGPRDFVLRMPGQGAVTSYDGNSPYSGAHRQLDTTELEPGDVDRAPLTYDVKGKHGRFDYRPGGTTVAVWTF